MAQNLIQTIITDEKIARVEAALKVLEDEFTDFIILDVDDRRSLRGMNKSNEQFCRETLIVGKDNPKLIPDTVGLQDAADDLVAYDRLLPLHTRLTRIMTRWDDTLHALGSDVVDASSAIYLLLKAFGKSMGLDELRKGLSATFRKTRRKPKAEAPAKE